MAVDSSRDTATVLDGAGRDERSADAGPMSLESACPRLGSEPRRELVVVQRRSTATNATAGDSNQLDGACDLRTDASATASPEIHRLRTTTQRMLK